MKSPLNLSKKEAERFKRYIYSYGDQRWREMNGGLSYNDDLK